MTLSTSSKYKLHAISNFFKVHDNTNANDNINDAFLQTLNGKFIK